MCERLVGLGDVNVAASRSGRVGRCGYTSRHVVELVDLRCFGRPARLVWHKVRWR
jgi:hypothetical protein